MSLLRSIASGLRSLFRKEQVSQELDEELNGFLEMAAEEKMKEGMSRQDARRAVRLERGGLELAKEVVRSGSWESFVETCWQDLRFSFRTLRKSPSFTAVAVMTLALGIGANTAVFSVVESVLLRPLPFQDSERLFAIWATQKEQADRTGASMPEFEDYKDQSHSFEYMANMLSGWTYTWTGQGEARTVNCTGISYDFFPMLGVTPYLGRLYKPEEYHVDGALLGVIILIRGTASGQFLRPAHSLCCTQGVRLGESCYEFVENVKLKMGPIRVQKVVAIRSLGFRWRVVSAVLYH